VREAIRHENLQIDLHIVSDGQKAIEFLDRAESNEDAPCPQCMLLDLNLPKVEGFEILRRVRASGKYAAIPVVVITSSDSPEDRSQAAALGAGYFRKPPSYEEFLKLGAVLKQLVEKQSAG
jgi:chemotaxis family two-component system response regulator Rcp1